MTRTVGMEQPFVVNEVNEKNGTVTITLRRDFVETVSWALKHCPQDRRRTKAANMCGLFLFICANYLFGQKTLDNIQFVERVIDKDGNEIEADDVEVTEVA